MRKTICHYSFPHFTSRNVPEMFWGQRHYLSMEEPEWSKGSSFCKVKENALGSWPCHGEMFPGNRSERFQAFLHHHWSWVCSLSMGPGLKVGGRGENTMSLNYSFIQREWHYSVCHHSLISASEIKRILSINNLRRNAECVDDYPQMETLPEPF